MDPGTVILIRWPNSAGGHKDRPTVVVSSRAYNQSGSDVVAVAVTSVDRRDPEDIAIPITDPEFLTTGLAVSSWIRCGKLYTFDLNESKHRILGAVGQDTLREIRSRLRELLL